MVGGALMEQTAKAGKSLEESIVADMDQLGQSCAAMKESKVQGRSSHEGRRKISNGGLLEHK